MKKKKVTKKSTKPKPTHFLTICADCKIRLVVRKECSKACDLCGSLNISVSEWR